MELDDLKKAWQIKTESSATQKVTDDELFIMLRKKASNTIELLKRSVRFELWFSIIFIVACIAFRIQTKDETAATIALIIIIISTGFCFYYYKKLSQLNKLNIENISLKENLTNIIRRFEKFLFIYRWGYNILIPISMLAGALLGLQAAKGSSFVELFKEMKIWLILIAILLPLGFIFNYGLKWYLNKLYGNYISRLRSILSDLDD